MRNLVDFLGGRAVDRRYFRSVNDHDVSFVLIVCGDAAELTPTLREQRGQIV